MASPTVQCSGAATTSDCIRRPAEYSGQFSDCSTAARSDSSSADRIVSRSGASMSSTRSTTSSLSISRTASATTSAGSCSITSSRIDSSISEMISASNSPEYSRTSPWRRWGVSCSIRSAMSAPCSGSSSACRRAPSSSSIASAISATRVRLGTKSSSPASGSGRISVMGHLSSSRAATICPAPRHGNRPRWPINPPAAPRPGREARAWPPRSRARPHEPGRRTSR